MNSIGTDGRGDYTAHLRPEERPNRAYAVTTTYARRLACILAVLLLAGCTDTMSASTGEAAFHAGEPLVNEQVIHAPWIATKNTVRVNTNDPVKAAVTISRTVWPATDDNQRPNGVVLVPNDDWAIAMAAADLIHFPNNGPVLYITKDSIPDETLSELKRLKPKGSPENGGVQAIVVGDVDASVTEEIKELGLQVDVIKGDQPAKVAADIDAYYTRVNKEQPKSVVIASTDDAKFALPAVNWIAHMPEPVLYVSNKGIPQATADALAKRRKQAVMYVIGPEQAVPEGVAKELEVFGRVVRIQGKDPMQQAIAFAKYKDNKTGFGWGITTAGHNFSFVREGDEWLAIAQAPFAHLGKHAPLLWMSGWQVPDDVRTYLESVRPRYITTPVEGPYNAAWLTGAEGSVMPSVQSEIDALLEIEPKKAGSKSSPHAGHHG
ncbi:cell wall-binding repeat-containing protein [Paenibacillus sp. MER TA 81-3]|uniref:cell wall-binding repeat-containing protein n=1 Tax=Paenibacillus sp. MER TA 81-3 TaxID=2939573 RepID=UPI00203F5A43|nr:cell wall-binding repeat-containing protein [Paenibacillus sp. MER TA 81-3]MCM3342646.1 cell wall-binding repeat-containing protein [Paenibacillus sp. MER TA 81-3]